MATTSSEAPSKPLHLIPWANAENRRDGHSIWLMLKSIVFFGAIFFSGAVGWLVYMSWQPFVLLLSPKLFRVYGDRLGSWWAQIPAFLCNYIYGINLVVTGDPLDKNDKASIFISNHTTLFDWLFLWDFFLRQQRLLYEKIVLKGSLKSLPFFGWSMQAMKFIFVARNKGVDLPHLRDMLNSFAIE